MQGRAARTAITYAGTVPEVRALLVHLLDTRQWDEAEILHWSAWRQERNRIAKECHRKRRLAELARSCRAAVSQARSSPSAGYLSRNRQTTANQQTKGEMP